jgi:hypothetical protein
MAEEPLTIRNTIIFLRMAAGQVRKIADESGEPSEAMKFQLRRIADQCHAEAKELAERFGIMLPGKSN